MRFICNTSPVTVDQVEQGKQVNPHDVDEVPVQAADFEWGVILGREAAFPGHPEKPGENAEPDNHVQGVQPGHDEVKSKENLGVLGIGVLTGMTGNLLVKTEGRAGDVMLIELVFVFDPFDAEEGASEDHGEREHGEQKAAARSLCGPDGEHDGQAAADEDGGVGAAESSVNGRAGGGEVSEVPSAVDQVGAEQAAEKHDLGREEDPHAEVGGVALLLFGGEVVQESGIVSFSVSLTGNRCCWAIRHWEPPRRGERRVPRSYKPPKSQRALPQSCRWWAEIASSTRGLRRSTDCRARVCRNASTTGSKPWAAGNQCRARSRQRSKER